jgi:hypothetical protein
MQNKLLNPPPPPPLQSSNATDASTGTVSKVASTK